MFTDKQRKKFIERDLEIRRVDQQLADLKHKQWKALPKIHTLDNEDLQWLLNNLTAECVWIRLGVHEEILRREEGSNE
jgi:hypothetical protein